VKEVFQVLCEHKLALKRSKCSFGEVLVAYLTHIKSKDSVAMDQAKIAAVEASPCPWSLQALCSFLSLTGYYRWLQCGGCAAHGSPEGGLPPPLLQMPDFSKCFMVDCDASGAGFGAVLHQGDGVIAYFNRVIAP
jgi:hypothetical protein